MKKRQIFSRALACSASSCQDTGHAWELAAPVWSWNGRTLTKQRPALTGTVQYFYVWSSSLGMWNRPMIISLATITGTDNSQLNLAVCVCVRGGVGVCVCVSPACCYHPLTPQCLRECLWWTWGKRDMLQNPSKSQSVRSDHTSRLVWKIKG